MNLFTIIDTHTGVEADMDAVRYEQWAEIMHDPRIRIDGWVIDEDGGIGLIDRCGGIAWAPSRFEIRWNPKVQR